MPKTFLTVGATTTESIDSHRPVWVLLPEATIPAVASTYARQIYPGTRVLVWLGSSRNLFNHHFWPQLNALKELSLKTRKPEYAAISAAIDAFAGDSHKRAQILVSYLSGKRRIDSRHYTVIEKIAQRAPLTGKEIRPLIEAVCAALPTPAVATAAQREKLQDFIETGRYDTETILWLALCVEPRCALQLWRDELVDAERSSTGPAPDQQPMALQQEFRRAIEKIRSGDDGPHEVGSIDLSRWFISLNGCAPRQRFFAEVSECHEGLNRAGCLKFDASSSFRDFGETAPRFIALDKLSRALTAFDRTLSHLVIRFAKDDSEMQRLSENQPLHSGLLVRGLVGDSEATRLLYPLHSTMIPHRPALSEHLIDKTRAAVADGSLARVCARHYGLSAAQLQRGLDRLLMILRKTLPLLPIEVHHLADAIEARVRLRKAAEAGEGSGATAAHRRQAHQLEILTRTQMARQFGLAKTLKADFRVDPTKLFYIDNLLIDRIKAIYGSELEFMRRVLAGYIERHNQAQHSAAASGSAVNS